MPRRNFGCRIDAGYIYRGLRTLVMENEKVRISILLDKGTDIFEFLHKPTDTDFMWQAPWDGLRDARQIVPSVNDPFGNFNEWYHGGWQELFPNAGPGAQYKGAKLGQHGEVCHLPWEYHIVVDTPELIRVQLLVDTYRTPYRIEKMLTLRENSGALEIEETVWNNATEPMEFMWGHHPAFGYPFLDEGMLIDIPGGTLISEDEAPIEKKYRVAPKTSGDWPNITDRNGNDIDFSFIPSRSQKTDDMMFVLQPPAGWYGLTNPKRGVGFGMKFDPKIFKTIWIWQVLGGQGGYPGWGNMYVMAVEPVTGLPPLTRSIVEGTAVKIEAGSSLSTKLLAVAYESDGRIKGFDDKGNVIR